MTIKKCNENHRQALLDYLSEDPSFNLFMIGDIENFGFDTDFQELWMEINENNSINSVLLRYEGNFIVSAHGRFDAKSYLEIIENHPKTLMVSGEKEIVEELTKCLTEPWTRTREFYFAELTQDNFNPSEITDTPINKASVQDVYRLHTLHRTIEEFKDSQATPESKKRSMENGSSRTFFVEDEAGKVISMASTTAENTFAAMVVGVCTLEEARGEGYATKLMTKLSQDVLSEGKTLCLFYDNPSAGAIYKRIGYQDIGKYLMVYKPN